MRIEIHDDLDAYENKFMGNFTKRQAVCVLLASCLIIPSFALIWWYTRSVDLAAIIALLLGFPVIACGVFKISGVPLEKVVAYKWKTRNCKRQRPFKMTNLYDEAEKLEKRMEEQEANEEKKEKPSKKANSKQTETKPKKAKPQKKSHRT